MLSCLKSAIFEVLKLRFCVWNFAFAFST